MMGHTHQLEMAILDLVSVTSELIQVQSQSITIQVVTQQQSFGILELVMIKTNQYSHVMVVLVNGQVEGKVIEYGKMIQ